MDLMLKGKIVLITGGTGSVGASLTKAFLEEDAVIVNLDTKKGKVNDKQYHFIETDISDPESIKKAFSAISEKFSTVDVLINNAGVFSSTPILDISPCAWDDIMKTNLRSVLLCSQWAARIMMKKGYGKIINIASMGGQIGGIFAGADYSTSKAGIICLTKSLAKNLGQYGIRVNCLNPGPLETDMTKDWPKQVLDDLRKKVLIGENRLGRPDEVANVVVFLSSDRASFIQGAQIDINGGIFIH